MRQNNQYRLDIQGLRAIAVLAVVIFHINPNRLLGGFIGVDIFFVISGYLIIGIIWRDLNKDNFSLINFYSRRVNRLFPALFTMTFVISILGYFVFLPEEMNNYAKSLISSLFYISNFYFYSISGYFDSELKFSPLLHTWSLSIEEQFYIVFPLLLWLIYRKKPKSVIRFFIVIGILSLILSECLLYSDESLSFFSSPSRVWQFISGGLIAIYPGTFKLSKVLSDILGLIGLIIIFSCLFLYSEELSFPGINALLPTLATVMVIYSGNNPNLIYKFLSLSPFTFFGKISYSLYLWHWPVIIFYKLTINNTISKIGKLEVLFLSIVLGYLSWRFIEQLTKNRVIAKRSLKPIVISLSATVLVSVIAVISLDGLPYRYSKQQLWYSSFMNYGQKYFREGNCFFTTKYKDFKLFNKQECVVYDENKNNILLIGDSHAAHWYSALATKMNKKTETLSQVTLASCRPLIEYDVNRMCSDMLDWAYQNLIKTKRFDKIILSAAWDEENLKDLLETITKITEYTDEIVILGPIVSYAQPLPRLLAKYTNKEIFEFSEYDRIKKADDAFIEALAGKPVVYISVLNKMCSNGSDCITTTDKDVPMQFDRGHLTHEGAVYLINKLNGVGG